jgi:hypothetical protein
MWTQQFTVQGDAALATPVSDQPHRKHDVRAPLSAWLPEMSVQRSGVKMVRRSQHDESGGTHDVRAV